jgi:hypothetical protein
VPRFLSPHTFAAAMLFIVTSCILLISTRAAAQDVTRQSSSVVGRLATIEPSLRRLTMIVEGEVDLVELFVARDAVVIEDGRTITLSELVIRTGRRILVETITDGERRIAIRVSVERE